MTATEYTMETTTDQRLSRFCRVLGVSRQRSEAIPELLLRIAIASTVAVLMNGFFHNQAHAQTGSPPAQVSQITTTLATTGTLTGTVTAPASVTSPVSPTISGGSWIEGLLPSDPDETRKIVLTAVLTVLGTLFVVFFKRIAAMVGTGAEWIWRHLRVERAIEGSYRRRLGRELRSIQLFSMPEEKNLETFFIPLRLVGWMEPDLRDQGTATVDEPIHLQDALERFKCITIVGNPGAGKTTITSHAAAAIADDHIRIRGKEYFPVVVHLRRLKPFLEGPDYESKSLIDLASEHLERHGFPEPEKYLQRRLDEGECFFVLDGFDEIADREGILQQRLANKVRELVDVADPENRLVLTSRSAGYVPAWFRGFRVLEMTDLSLEQAGRFVAGWFGESRKEQAMALQAVLNTNDRLQMLVTNPLMLAIVCFVYSTKDPKDEFLPRRRVDLYDRCVEALIAKWDESRGVRRDSSFTTREIEAVLSYVALDALRQKRIDFSRKDLLALIRTYLPEVGRRHYEDEEFLKEVLEHTGLFRSKAHDAVGFLHLTFQEYLAAKAIQEKVLVGALAKDVRSQITEVIANVFNPAWVEPIALAAGILRGRTELVDELYAVYKAQPGAEIAMLLALCLRDADLEDFSFDPDHMIKRDEILAKLVAVAKVPPQ